VPQLDRFISLAMTKTKSPAECAGLFVLASNIVKEEIRPWQAWQRPTLPSLEA
jgi:hypothetical protein